VILGYGAGPTWDTASGNYRNGLNQNGTFAETNTNQWNLHGSQTVSMSVANLGFSGSYDIMGADRAGLAPNLVMVGAYRYVSDSGSNYYSGVACHGYGGPGSNQQATGVRVKFASHNIASGRVSLYAIQT
jgi:hypothetical protein